MSLYSSAVLQDGPLGFWQLNEQSGTTVVDSSGNGRNGVYHGTAGQTATASPNHGDYAYFFNGSNAYASLPNLGTSSTFTAEAWIHATTNTQNNAGYQVFSTEAGGGTTTTGFYLWGDNEDPSNLSTGIFAGSPTGANGGAALGVMTPGVWYHLVMTFASGTASFYVNGTLVQTRTGVTYAPTPTASQANAIGALNSATPQSYFYGIISNVAYYQTALSASRIAAHYSAMFPTSTGALTASASSSGSGTSIGKFVGGGTGVGPVSGATASSVMKRQVVGNPVSASSQSVLSGQVGTPPKTEPVFTPKDFTDFSINTFGIASVSRPIATALATSCVSGETDATSNSVYSLVGSVWKTRVTLPDGLPTGSVNIYLQSTDGINSLVFTGQTNPALDTSITLTVVYQGNVIGGVDTAGLSFWVRMREVSGTVMCDYSNDGLSWDTLVTVPTVPWMLYTNLLFDAQDVTSVVFDQLNTSVPRNTSTATVNIPHVYGPWTLDRFGRPEYVQQDSTGDIQTCVLNLLSCPQGANPYDPDFGLPDLRGVQPVTLSVIENAIADYEPRVTELTVDQLDAVLSETANLESIGTIS